MLPPGPMPEGLDDVAFIKTFGDAMCVATALRITFGENRKEVYYSDAGVDIRAAFTMLVNLIGEGMDDDYEFAFLEHDTPEEFIRSLHFQARYSIVFSGEKPATIDIDIDRKRLIFVAGEKWASFVFDSRASARLETYILDQIRTTAEGPFEPKG